MHIGRSKDTDVCFGDVFTGDTKGKGIVIMEFLVAGRRIFRKGGNGYQIIFLVIGRDEVEYGMSRILGVIFLVQGNGDNRILAGGFRRNGESSVVDILRLIVLKLAETFGFFFLCSYGLGLLFCLVFGELTGIDGILDGLHIATGCHVNGRCAVGRIIGLKGEGKVCADKSFADTDYVISLHSPATDSVHAAVGSKEVQATVVVIVTQRVVGRVVLGEIDPGKTGKSSLMVVQGILIDGPIVEIVEQDDVGIVGAMVINHARNQFHEHVPVRVQFLGVDLKLKFTFAFCFGIAPESVTAGGGTVLLALVLMQEGFRLAGPDAVQVIVLHIGPAGLTPVLLSKGKYGLLFGLGIEDVLPCYHHHIEFELGGITGVEGSILRVFNLEGEVVFYAFLCGVECNVKRGFRLTAGENDFSHLENIFLGRFHGIRNLDFFVDEGLVGLTGNGNGNYTIHFGIESVAAGSLLRGEINPVAVG